MTTSDPTTRSNSAAPVRTTGHLRYVVVSPARNEADYIKLTLQSLVAQTAQPLKWVIVSDGSTDGTDDIVREFSALYPWIELLRMPERKERDFSGKVGAFKAGFARVQDLPYEVVVSLDADISFDSEYFAFLLEKLHADSRLGLVGTPFEEGGKPVYDYRFVSDEHVSGACQVFRRECFEAIGGYIPVKGGGIDYIAVTTARMKGWKTRTFTEKACTHHRVIGTAQNGVLTARFKVGRKDYAMGHHPLWEAFRSVYQMSRRPYVLGGIALFSGFVAGTIRGAERPVSRELIAFIRADQMRRLRKKFLGGK
ncbi:MAG: glycosyltransferase family 2 protein [Bryobacteraceae bacterium]